MERDYSAKNLIDKLGIRRDARVAVIGIKDVEFWRQLGSRTTDIAKGRIKKKSDAIFFAADCLHALERLEKLRAYLKSNGAIWVVSLKGKLARLKDVQVISSAKRAGLVDVKVVSFSETHTALKLVIPVAKRASRSEKR